MGDKDTDPHCQVKALYAVSCLVRESKEGLANLTELDGWSVLVRALQRTTQNYGPKVVSSLGLSQQLRPRWSVRWSALALFSTLQAMISLEEIHLELGQQRVR